MEQMIGRSLSVVLRVSNWFHVVELDEKDRMTEANGMVRKIKGARIISGHPLDTPT